MTPQMRKFIIWGFFLFIILAVSISGCSSYNNMLENDQNVKKEWSNVEAQYQRRMDLIPNLVNTVQGYANFEKSTLTEITELRSQAGQAKIDFSNSNSSVDQKVKAAEQMESALSRLLVIVEKYPDLKANENFMGLQAELAGTENRVGKARYDFSGAVNDYNTYILSFPQRLWNSFYGFKEHEYFKAQSGAENAPKVEFK